MKLILEDPLGNAKVTPLWLTESETAMQRVTDRASALQVPLLFLMGGADSNSNPAASRCYFESIPYPDKELHEFSGAYTNVLSEPNVEEVLEDIDEWLDKHL